MADGSISVMPRHIAIILDGNGRWAKKRGLPRTEGHRRGAKTVNDIVEACIKRGIESLTLYAFSTENWKRPQTEVDAIMNLLRRYLEDAESFRGKNVRVRFLGERSRLAQDIIEKMGRIEDETASADGMNLNIAINYGGREELTQAARVIAQRAANGELDPADLTENDISEILYTAGQPELDLMIRPSGEQRLSNFLLWQSAYAELVFQDVLWPDYSEADLDKALEIFAGRSRRFGGV